MSLTEEMTQRERLILKEVSAADGLQSIVEQQEKLQRSMALVADQFTQTQARDTALAAWTGKIELPKIVLPSVDITLGTVLADLSRPYTMAVNSMFNNLALGAVQSVQQSIANQVLAAFKPIYDMGSLFSALQSKHQRHWEQMAAWLEIDPYTEHEYYDSLSWEQFKAEAYAVRWMKETARAGQMQTPDSVAKFQELLRTGQISGYTLARFTYLLLPLSPPPPPSPSTTTPLYAVVVDDPETAELLERMLKSGKLDKQRLLDLERGHLSTLADVKQMVSESLAQFMPGNKTKQPQQRPMVKPRGMKIGTAERVTEFHNLLKAGHSYRQAKQRSCCDPSTYYQWCKEVTGEEPIPSYR